MKLTKLETVGMRRTVAVGESEPSVVNLSEGVESELKAKWTKSVTEDATKGRRTGKTNFIYSTK
jgi:hypothetical protein